MKSPLPATDQAYRSTPLPASPGWQLPLPVTVFRLQFRLPLRDTADNPLREWNSGSNGDGRGLERLNSHWHRFLTDPLHRLRWRRKCLQRTYPAVAALAGLCRRTVLRWVKVVAVVGSVGKTTTTGAIRAALGGLNTGCSVGNRGFYLPVRFCPPAPPAATSWSRPESSVRVTWPARQPC